MNGGSLVPVLLILLSGCGSGSPDDSSGLEWTGNNTETVAFDLCVAECPDGTQQAEYSSLEILETDAFFVLDGECQSICEPVAPCVWPNVPVVSQDSYQCLPLEGFSDFEADNEVDMTWSSAPTFAQPVVVDSGLNLEPTGAVVGDLDGDGLDDLAIYLNTDVELQLSGGGGSFSAYPATTLNAVEHAVLTDMDSDGLDDLLVREVDTSGVAVLAWYASTGTALSTRTELRVLGANAAGPAVADVDGNGTPDVTAIGDDLGGAQIGWNRGASWNALGACSGSCGRHLRLADVDGDGLLDVLTEAQWWPQTSPNLFGAAAGVNQAGLLGVSDALWFGDLTGDGLADALAAHFGYTGYDTNLWLMSGDGLGGFTTGLGVVVTDCDYPSQLAVGDLDGDGWLEPAVGSSSCPDEVALGFFGRFDVDGGGVDDFSLVFRELGGLPVVGNFSGTGDELVTVLP